MDILTSSDIMETSIVIAINELSSNKLPSQIEEINSHLCIYSFIHIYVLKRNFYNKYGKKVRKNEHFTRQIVSRKRP